MTGKERVIHILLLLKQNTGEIVSMAPNYDNNIALTSRGYLNTTDRSHDGLVGFFRYDAIAVWQQG